MNSLLFISDIYITFLGKMVLKNEENILYCGSSSILPLILKKIREGSTLIIFGSLLYIEEEFKQQLR